MSLRIQKTVSSEPMKQDLNLLGFNMENIVLEETVLRKLTRNQILIAKWIAEVHTMIESVEIVGETVSIVFKEKK